MKPIWQIDAEDVIGLQGRDVDFVQFLNDLLQHQASAGGLPGVALQLNLKVRAPDGGVDGVVTASIPAHADPEGFFGVPTCWQFKASPTGSIKPGKRKKRGQEAALRAEIRKPEAAKLVASGYGYRFCIADDMAPPTKAKWEACLLEEARRIHPGAPPPMVVTASDLAGWANRLPGVVLPFRPYLGQLQSLRKWGKEITADVPQFVPVAAWASPMEVIGTHADFAHPCIGVAHIVHGEAGVGKTRCVYESLLAHGENHARVVYTNNEIEAERIAGILANDEHFCGVIVADECSVEARVRLERRLEAHSKRVRLITIDNRQQEEATGTVEIRLERMTENEVEQILLQGFSEIPRERLRAFIDLSGRFVRLAIDLCRHSMLIPAEGHIDPILPFFRDHYLGKRLGREEDRAAVEVVSLLPRVGYRGDLRPQLEALCQAVDLHPDIVVQAATRLKQAPGFIALGERYLYVTPQLIAQAAFQSAWVRWVKPDPQRFFLQRLPGELLDLFAEQVRRCGTEAMRRLFFDFFQDWTSRLAVSDLGDETTVRRLVRLAEIEPQTMLPKLRHMIEQAVVEELRRLHSPHSRANGGDTLGRSAARRELVWLADKFARLPDHFADAERILLRLALAESEVYANNASGVWKELFRPYLSGTAIPFGERLRLLEKRFQTTNESQLTLCLGALDGPLTAEGTILGRALGPPVVAGRIPPPDWCPASAREARQCWILTVELLKRLRRTGSATVREAILEITLRRLSGLLRNGLLADVIEIVGPDPLPDARLAELLHELDQFLEVFCTPGSKHVPPEVEAAIRDWRRHLVPETLHGRLVSVIGQEPWQIGWRAAAWEQEVLPLAQDLLSDPAALDRELPWLCSRGARSAANIGFALGRLDQGTAQLERILRVAVASENPGVARGYIEGLARYHPDSISRVYELLNQFQATHPRQVFELLSARVDALRPTERLLAMVDAGQLPVELLRGIHYCISNRPLSWTELRQALDRLTVAAEQGNAAAAQAAVHILWRELRPPTRPMSPDLRSAPELQGLLQTTLTLSLPVIGREGYAWVELLPVLGELRPEAAICLAVLAVAGNDFGLAEQAQSYLTTIAPQHAEAVMQGLGEALLNPAVGWRLAVRHLRNLVAALPAPFAEHWLDTHGHPGAVALARHLPLPFVNPSGEAVVPKITAYVLERFGDDEAVFSEFCAGTHSGQVYSGDIAAHHEQEGEAARRFLDHPLPRIQEWAQHELAFAARESSWWRVREEEMTVP